MRLFVRIALGLLVLWTAYAVSPYVTLYRLALAVEARDVEGIRSRVNLKAVSLSLARQLVPEYLKTVDRELKPADRDFVMGLGATVADPLIERLLRPDVLVDLMEDGWPEAVAPVRPAGYGGFDIAVLRQLGRLFLASETRGFRAVTVSLPENRPKTEQFRLRLRFAGLRWRVVGFDLPTPLKENLVRQMPKLH